jgi:hypothetical protein
VSLNDKIKWELKGFTPYQYQTEPGETPALRQNPS